MSIESCISEHLHWMEVHNFARSSVANRRNALERWSRWCEELGIHQPGDVSVAVLESYQRHLYRLPGKGLKPRLAAHTQVLHLNHIQVFYRWLVRSGVVIHDPAAQIVLPREEQRLPRLILSLAEITKLLELPDITTLHGLRDRAILELFYSTAMRSSDARDLQVTDINLADRIVLLKQGKTKRDRYVPLGERCAHWLEKYLSEARPLLVKDGTIGHCFIEGGAGYRDSQLSNMVRGYLQKAGLPVGQGSCHLLRHACATHMLHNGADIRSIQELLGHQHLTTTQVYTRVALTDLRRVHAKTHPLSGLGPTT